MAIAATVNFKTVWGNQRIVFGTLAFDASYPTNGEAITVAALGDNYFRFPEEVGVVLFPNQGYTFLYRPDTGKIQAFSTAATEVTNATDLSALTNVQYIVIGK